MRVAAFPERIARELLEMYRYLKQNGFAIDRSRRTGYRQPVDSGLKFFELAEDATSGAIYAKRTNRTNTVTDTELTVVYNWEGLLTDAQAGYVALFGRVTGEWVFVQGPCITQCDTTGTLSVGMPPDGTVGDEYTHTVTGTNLTGAITMTGLPPGLSQTGGVITGTPTTAGTYVVFASAVAGDCTLTRSFVITIGDE